MSSRKKHRANKGAIDSTSTVVSISQDSNVPGAPIVSGDKKVLAQANFVGEKPSAGRQKYTPLSPEKIAEYKKIANERKAAYTQRCLQEFSNIIENDPALLARLHAVIEASKLSPTGVICVEDAHSKNLLNRMNKPIREENGTFVKRWHAKAHVFQTTTSKSLVDWAIEIEPVSAMVSQMTEFIPSITKHVQFTADERQNKDRILKLFGDFQDKITEAGDAINGLIKLKNTPTSKQKALAKEVPEKIEASASSEKELETVGAETDTPAGAPAEKNSSRKSKPDTK